MAAKVNKILIPLTILSIPAYLIKFSIFNIPTNALEILVLIILALSFFKEKFDFKKLYEGNKIYLWGIALILFGLVISTLVGENYRTGFGIIKGWFIIPLVFCFVLIREMREVKEMREVLRWLYLSVFLVALVSLFYYFSGNLTYDGRLKAFYLSSNHLAMYLAPGVIIGVYLIRDTLSQLKDEILAGRRRSAYTSKHHLLFLSYIVSFFIISLNLYLSYSYAAWLAVILSLIIMAFIKGREINRRVVLVSLIILLLVIISQWNVEKFANLKNFTRSSLESRIVIWQSAGKILKDNLIFGIGPGNFQAKYLEYQKFFPPYLEWAVPQPHNLYLAFWLQAGIIGLAGFIILILKWFKELIALVKKQKSSADIAAVLLGIVLYILLHGLADTTYWKNDLAMIFWIVFSLGLMIKKLNTDAV